MNKYERIIREQVISKETAKLARDKGFSVHDRTTQYELLQWLKCKCDRYVYIIYSVPDDNFQFGEILDIEDGTTERYWFTFPTYAEAMEEGLKEALRSI